MCEFLKEDSSQKSGKSETAIAKIYNSVDLKSANFALQLITARHNSEGTGYDRSLSLTGTFESFRRATGSCGRGASK